MNQAPSLLLILFETFKRYGYEGTHLGLQVESSEDVEWAITRFQQAGLATFAEKDTDCCYAMQDKVWVTDPDGTSWEVFFVKVADTEPESNRSNIQVSAESATKIHQSYCQ